MTAHVLAFTGSKKPRRETKADLAKQVLPKVLGVMQRAPVDRTGHPYIMHEIGSFRFRADHWNPEPSTRFVEVCVWSKGAVVLEGYIHSWPQPSDSNMHFNRRVWLRQFDFAGRLEWVPQIAQLDGGFCSPEAFYSWFAPLART